MVARSDRVWAGAVANTESYGAASAGRQREAGTQIKLCVPVGGRFKPRRSVAAGCLGTEAIHVIHLAYTPIRFDV